jgi:SAM-dependent methyltransferase
LPVPLNNTFPEGNMLKLLPQPLRDKLDALSWWYDRKELVRFTRRYSLDFGGFIPREELSTSAKDSLAHSNNYRPYSNHLLKALIQEALSSGIQFQNFVDIGCGKGLPSLFARKYFRFAKVYGIDFSEPLIDAAKQNVAKLGWQDVSFVVADASKWKAPEGNTLFFMFNPFDAVILERFLTLNLDHFTRNRSLIAYATDDCRETMLNLGFEILFRSEKHQQSVLRYSGSP